jgi:hypothetical protein
MLTVVNAENFSDTATVPISVSTPKTSTLPPLLELLIQRFPVLQQLLHTLM